jgi:hypothetical protein
MSIKAEIPGMYYRWARLLILVFEILMVSPKLALEV